MAPWTPQDLRTKVVGAVLIALALGAWLLNRSTDDAAGPYPRPAHTPDYWVEALKARTTGPDGQPRRILHAESLRHYPDDNSTELTAPELRLLEPGRPPWRVRSQQGWVSPDGKLILLLGEVHIDRDAAPGVDPIHLVTRDLRVQPDDEYAETDRPVRADSGPHRVSAVGMQAWLRKPVRIKLLADVRGHYEVEP
jgi:lipopolysaccharide export system protein LptC